MEVKKLKVLIVDDDPSVRMALRATLVDSGFQVRTAESPYSALDIADEYHPDVVVSDWELGTALNGIELCKALIGRIPRAKIILMTGAEKSRMEKAAASVRPCAVLQKPFDMYSLVGELEKLGRMSYQIAF